MYHVWWLIPAQTMSTSFIGITSSLPMRPSRRAHSVVTQAICEWPPCTPWHSPMVLTPPYWLHAQVFMAMGLA